MSDEYKDVLASTAKSQKQITDLMSKLVAVAQPGAVYSPAVTSGDQTVITAAEVTVGMGFGMGFGGGSGPGEADSAEEKSDAADETGRFGVGGGGGGGGFSTGRPVAMISIGPDGVQVEPVVDATKIALAFFTTFGAMLMMLGRMRRAARR